LITLVLLAAIDDEPARTPAAKEASNERAAPPIAAPPAPTPTPTERRYPSFEIALRSGVSIPIGGMAQGRFAEPIRMAHVAGLQVPVFVDLGWRLSPAVFVGGYGSIALGPGSERFERDTCLTTCRTLSVHAGAQVHVHLAPRRRVDPWLGIGVGYESLTTAGSPAVDARGFEIARPAAGVDLRLSPLVAGGLFVDGTIVAYTSAESDLAGITPNRSQVPFKEELDRPYIHSWVTFGIRFVFHAARRN
jgi:hypothetical protein